MIRARVLFFSTIFPRPWNVTKGIYCFHACRALEELGHEVRVVSPRSFRERAGTPKALDGLAEMRVDYPRYVYPPGLLHGTHDRFLEASSAPTMRRVLREFRPDCILSYWAHPDGEVAARFGHRVGIPTGVIVGGSDVLVLARAPGRRRSVIRALHATDVVLTVGRDLADAVVALGVPARKVHVVHQGIDKRLFSPGPASEARRRLGIEVAGKVLVSVGNLLPVKGLDVLLDALASLAAPTRPRLYLVGEGDARADLEARVARQGLQGAVTFVGKLAQAELPDWYRAADLTVLSSRSEGIPNVLRESLACGTPFVATRVGGVDEIAAGTSCPLVAPEDAHALASAIASALERPPDVTRAREAFLTWPESSQRTLDLLLDAAPGGADT